MADDIDIEEHDLLDNPVIKSIFPDISVIKREISEYYEDVLNIKQEPEVSNTEANPVLHTNANENVKAVHEQDSTGCLDNSESTSNKRITPFQGTKIILGSKPNKNVQQTKVVAVERVSKLSHQEEQLTAQPLDSLKADKNVVEVNSLSSTAKVAMDNRKGKHTNMDESFQGTKIILGSKPSKTDQHTKDIEIDINKRQNISLQSVVRIPKLLLQDLGEYIYQSNRYCKHCKTLFPSKLDFHVHKQQLHSIKTTQSRPSLKPKKVLLEQHENKCTICNSRFSRRSNLMRHFRNVHKKVISSFQHTYNNKHTKNKSHTTLKPESQSGFHSDKSDKKIIITRKTKLNVKVALENPISKKNTNKCVICGSFFSNVSNLRKHYKNIHKKKVSSKSKHIKKNILKHGNNVTDIASTNITTRSNTKPANSSAKISCFHCSKDFPDQNSLIEHIYEVLEPKNYPNLKRGKTLTPDKKQYNSAKTQLKNDTPATKSLKEKLVFENQDSNEKKSEKKGVKNEVSKTRTKRKAQHVVATIPAGKEKRKNSSDDECHDANSCNSERRSLRKKRKYDGKHLSDTDANVRKRRFLDTNKYKSSSDTTKLKQDINALESASSSKQENLVNKTKSDLKTNIRDADKPKSVYECVYCTYVLPTSRAYYMHIFGKHKVGNVSRVNKVTFNKQCKYCPSENANEMAHNTHVHRYHYDLLHKTFNDESEEETDTLQNPAFKKVKSFVLKTIIYKCIKCDIHFLSSCVAKDHEKHMELLVNWKCSKCKRIFKRHDKHLHLKQHSFSKTLNVCQFNQTELNRLMYICTKCAIHFTEERFLEHYSKCEIQIADSVYCKNCDILIDKCGYTSHEAYHKMGNNIDDFIVMIGDIITVSKNQEQENAMNFVKKRKRLYEQVNCLTFCETCKCYLTDIAISRKAHVEGRCSTMVKYTCNLCGLVLTNKSINTHRQNHKKRKALKIQHFKFFNMKGLQIRPPIPEYPRCSNCEVTFVSKNAANSHICSEMEYLTCQICNVKLTENAYKLHMNFHSYRMPNEKQDKSRVVCSKTLEQYDIKLDKCTPSEPNPESALPFTDKSEALPVNELLEHKTERVCHTKTSNLELCNDTVKTNEMQTNLPMVSLELEDETTVNLELNASFPEARTDPQVVKLQGQNIEPNMQTQLSTVANDIKDVGKSQIYKDKVEADSNAKRYYIIYTCQSCGISIDTYDKVIQHCQNHYSPIPKKSDSLKICVKCSLKFEIENYDVHQKEHLICDTILYLTFDPTYFTADNSIWTRHIFASVSPAIQKEVIEKSMYQHECRIKMDITKQAPSHLTVYKCCRCGYFIGPDCIVLHIKEPCYKTCKKYPCSVCGIPLVSSDYRTTHEQIHRRYDNIRLKSYNIVLINCETHKSFNASIINAIDKYILYQCRTCDGIVNESQRNSHTCNVHHLQKCTVCGLILCKDDYAGHISKHSELPMYNIENIKVILFGNKEYSIENKILTSSFSGMVCDYKLYKCNQCEVCENNNKFVSRHACTFDDSKWKCPKCSYFMSSRSIKQHIKRHDLDTDFKTDNIKVIDFGLAETDFANDGKNEKHDNADNESADNHEDEQDYTQCVKTDSNSIKKSDEGHSEELVALYKCACGLHYMDKVTCQNHAKECYPKVKAIRQNCSKCTLAFNPKELFSHIIAHHSDKNKTYKYDIVEVAADI